MTDKCVLEQQSKAKMKVFEEKLVGLMDEYNVKVEVGEGEYNYNGISFVWFVDGSLKNTDLESRTSISSISIHLGQLPDYYD